MRVRSAVRTILQSPSGIFKLPTSFLFWYNGLSGLSPCQVLSTREIFSASCRVRLHARSSPKRRTPGENANLPGSMRVTALDTRLSAESRSRPGLPVSRVHGIVVQIKHPDSETDNVFCDWRDAPQRRKPESLQHQGRCAISPPGFIGLFLPPAIRWNRNNLCVTSRHCPLLSMGDFISK